MNNEIIQRLFDIAEMRATIMLDFKSKTSKEFNIPIKDIDTIIRYLEGKGYLNILIPNTNSIKLTSKGLEMKNGGWFKYLESDKESKSKKSEKTTNISIKGNYIGGDNHGIQSSKSDFINPEIHNASKTIASNPPKRSFLEIASWVFGIVVAIIAIYEFILKKL
ncbi:hypothetical protein [Flavobacterium sp.]|uniref:hypothetical protein n=1 Tax=Flavobacterium sp. TaxID=239 RepID=UPI00375075F6